MPARYFLDPEVAERVHVRSRGYLPHWEVEGGTYSVTFREHDSLPKFVMQHLREEHIAIRRAICGDAKPNAQQRSLIDEAFGMRLDAKLHEGRGACRLRDHAAVAAGALEFFDRQRYELFAWCVMPNHVHAVLTPRVPLQDILHSWKSFIAHRVGQPIFQKEYFDRLIRDERDLDATVDYVRGNPQAAGLTSWPFVG